MKIYAAGWALQSPALNYFKKFLRANGIHLSGIIYPKRIPDDLEGIAILDFDAARQVLTRDDKIILCQYPGVSDVRLGMELSAFFKSLELSTIRVSDFILSLVEQDHGNCLQFAAAHVSSSDIQKLREEPALSFFDDGFADLESFHLACSLDVIARSSDWDQLLAFDQDKTPEQVLYEVVTALQAQGTCSQFHVLDTPQLFLNALLKIKALNPLADLKVDVSQDATAELGARWPFYRRALACNDASASDKVVTYLAGSADAIIDPLDQCAGPANAIFLMQRSIIDYRRFRRSLGSSRHRVLLRQPDTVPGHLIAVYLT